MRITKESVIVGRRLKDSKECISMRTNKTKGYIFAIRGERISILSVYFCTNFHTMRNLTHVIDVIH